MVDQIIILGRGPSIAYLEANNLWYKLSNTLVIGCNMVYELYPEADIIAFVDSDLMMNDYYDSVKEYKGILITKPTVIKRPLSCLEHFQFQVCSRSEYCGKDGFKENKLYGASFTGLYALSIAMNFEPKEIFLLGFDGLPNGEYEEYSKNRVETLSFVKKLVAQRPLDVMYGAFACRVTPTIYNVTGERGSTINCFSKINYTSFFEKIKKQPRKPSKEEIKKYINQRRDGEVDKKEWTSAG